MTPVDNNQVVDRRRNAQASQSPREALEQLPALVLLERIPVPTLAVLQDGTIVFANKAFAEMVGRDAEEVVVLKFHDVFHACTGNGIGALCCRWPGEHGRRISSQGWLDGACADEQVGTEAFR